MANIIDTKITDISTSWENYSGQRVEEFIKEKLKAIDTSKFGYLVVESGDGGLQTMRFFKDEKSYNLWFSDKVRYADKVLSSFEFYSNRPEAKFTTKTSITKYPATNISKGASNILGVSYNCYWDTDPSQKDTTNGLLEVTINDVKIAALSRELVPSGVAQANNYNIELKDYFTSENNKVVVRITNTHGFDKTFTFNVTVYDLKVSFDENYDESIIQKGKWNLRVNCSGASATVYCKVKNRENYSIYTKNINNSSGEFIIDPNGTFDLGAHEIIVWAENKQLNLKTEEITTTYVKGSDLGNAVSALCFGKGIPTTAKQFSVINIPYFFYLPNDVTGSNITVSIDVIYDNSNKTKKLSNQIVVLNSSHTSGIKTIALSLDENDFIPEITVRIKVGSLTVTKNIKVEDIGVVIRSTDECKIYYTMKGKSNDDLDAKNLTSTYNDDVTSKLTRSNNFTLNDNNGFLDGYGMTIRPGKKLTLEDYIPFATDCGANGNKQGKTIELEFKSGICANEDDILIDCWNLGTGFRIYTNHIDFGCSTDVVKTYFPEQARIKVAFVIDGTTVHTRNDLGGNSIVENDANLAYLYVNGVIVRVFDYKSANWRQGTPTPLTIGCPTAMVELYSLRIYDKALTYNQILNNYAYDIPDVEDVYDKQGNFVSYGKVSIVKRNDILNTTGDVHKPAEIISRSKVVNALPSTPIVDWNIDELPFNKNNPDVSINGTEFDNPLWKSKDGDACAPFTVGAHMFNADGTSSNSYPLPYKNFAEIFKTAEGADVTIILDPKHTSKNVTAYSITKGLNEGEQELVHKVNFASSEGIFNIHAMNMFQKILLACAKNDDTLYTKFQKQQRDSFQDITYRKSLSGFVEIGFRKTSTSGTAPGTFLSFYNLINNKYNTTIFGFPKKDYKTAQIWEVDENINFFNRYATKHEIKTGKLVKSNITGQPIYYARIPKKSPTNKANKFGAVKAVTDNIVEANKELACITRFHNWVVDCNYHLAERYFKQHGNYETLATPVVYNGTTYTQDSPAYRRAKFVNEAGNYLVKSDALFYCVFCEYIIGMDSMDKNMSIAFDDITTAANGEITAAKARLFLRDTDSRDLFNNSGVLTFKYWHEWNDSYNSSTGETKQMSGEDYDNDTNAWSPHLESGFSPVFNGRYSGLIDMIYTCWGDDIKEMYKVMQSNGLNAKDMFQQYVDFWKQLCENIYNADAMGYVNTNNFEKAYGDKLQLSKYFYKKRSRYLDSKNCCGQSIVNNLRLRLYNQGKGIAIKHSSPMYASVQWGANNFATQRNIDGDYALIPFGFSNPQNATFDIDDADLISDIKTYTQDVHGTVTYYGFEGLGDFYFDANMGLCKSLTDFVMRYTETIPNTLEEGTSFDLSKMLLLKRVICTYVRNLKKVIEINSEICEEVDFTGSGIAGVKMLPNQYLKKLVLPKSITELHLTGFTNLTEDGLVLENVSNIYTFEYYDCPNIDFNKLFTRLINEANIKSFITKNLNIEVTSKTVFDKIIDAADENITGKIYCKGFTLTWADKLKITKKFGNIDDESNKLYIRYSEVAIDSGNIYGDDYVFNIVDDFKQVFVPTPDTGNNITKILWSISQNEYATINEITGKLNVQRVSSVADDKSATAKVTCVVETKAGKKFTLSKDIYFCKHIPQIGDFVYYDKTISDIFRGDKTLVGVIFYCNNATNDIRIVGHMDLPTYYYAQFVNPMKNGLKPGRDMPIFPKDTDWGIVDVGYDLDEWKYNDKVCHGQKQTLDIIKYRNSILNDPAVNIRKLVTTEESTEYEKVWQLSDYNKGLYAMTASVAYAYQPKVKAGEVLDNAFKEHRWYVGAWSEMAYLIDNLLNKDNNDGYMRFYNNAKKLNIASIFGKSISISTSSILNVEQAAALYIVIKSTEQSNQFMLSSLIWQHNYTYFCCKL